ncbi:DUF4304 domain-containing protein [Mucilaginibacter sp. 22184]|uniref:DUF4304 domain-containing protein n=1 Tax=Mucilaginibacter sp. 22184 TaxID=3453887 RepID=UPI003F841C5F
MKTIAETKFDRIAKEAYHLTLKPLGFKRNGNNFYIAETTDGIGKVINLQKYHLGRKENISFTVNVGIFSPLFWNGYYGGFRDEFPTYPKEVLSVIRRRIGNLMNTRDMWYRINADTDIEPLIVEHKHNLLEFILPFFNRINTNDDILTELEIGRPYDIPFWGKLVMYAELKKFKEAQAEYTRLFSKQGPDGPNSIIVALGKKYNLK